LTERAPLSKFEPLRRAERLIVDALAAGDIAKIGLRRPEKRSGDASVRGSFLAFVLRGGLPLKGRRLQLLGAFIEGVVDLGDTAIAGSLWFYRCTFDSSVMLNGARVAGAVTFADCHLSGLMAEACSFASDLVLNAGSRVDNEVRLLRARIGGDLDCTRLDLCGIPDPAQSRRALMADAVQVAGNVRLVDGFQAIGEVRFRAARVDGDFRASGNFTGNLPSEGFRGTALLMDRIVVAGSVQFNGGFFGAAGGVSLRQARIAGDLDATGASFDRLGDASRGDEAALLLDRARIDGALILQQLQAPLLGASFVGARVGTLADDETTWGERLALDGFMYSRLGEDSPLDTVFRVDWLECQRPTHLESHFRVQPWRRLIKVLRRMGHEHSAGSIAMRREHRLRRIGRVGSWAPPALRWLPRTGHALLGLLTGYGFRPGRLVGWLVAVWMLSGGAYWAAAAQGAAQDTSVPADAAEAAFSPLAYSLDRLLPLVALGQSDSLSAGSTWVDAMHWLGRFETVFGWAAALLLLASLAGWMDRDRSR
jgi:hypothetical protein